MKPMTAVCIETVCIGEITVLKLASLLACLRRRKQQASQHLWIADPNLHKLKWTW